MSERRQFWEETGLFAGAENTAKPYFLFARIASNCGGKSGLNCIILVYTWWLWLNDGMVDIFFSARKISSYFADTLKHSLGLLEAYVSSCLELLALDQSYYGALPNNTAVDAMQDESLSIVQSAGKIDHCSILQDVLYFLCDRAADLIDSPYSLFGDGTIQEF